MVDDAMDTDKGGETALGAAGAGTASNTTTTTKRKIEVKKWNAVAVWSWSTSFDSCAICRNTLHEPSIEFQANSQQEGDDGLSIAVRFTITRVYVAVVLLSFALSRRSAFSNAFVFERDSKTRSPSALSKTDHLFMRIPRSRSFSSRLNKLTVGELRSRVPLRLHLQVVETTVILPVVSKRVGVYEDGEDTVTGVGRERLRLRRERRGRDGVRWKYRRLHRPRRCI